MDDRSIRVTLSDEDFDARINGWHCSLLKVGVKVVAVYADGKERSADEYVVNAAAETIRWRGTLPEDRSISVEFELKQKASTEELTSFWKKVAIIGPILTAIVVPVIVGTVQYYFREPKPVISDCLSTPTPTPPSPTPVPTPTIGDWIISLETVNPQDGGIQAARQELIDKAKTQGFEKNSVILKSGDVHKIIIHFPTLAEANGNLPRAKEINKSVDKVRRIQDYCGTVTPVAGENELYACSKTFED